MRRLALAAAVPCLLSACGTAGPVHQAPPGPAASAEAQVVYAAIGASETVGVGTEDPRRLAWPQLFFKLLPRSAVLYNFGISGATTAVALQQEVPQAVTVHPTLVTVWLNVDDLLVGVSPGIYEEQLGRLVHALSQTPGVRVLVANTPWLDHLPAYLACRPDPPPGAGKCALSGARLPGPDQVNAEVDAYNAAIARVAGREGATVVDLHAAGEVPDTHPEWIGSDGFHPNAAGAAQVAATFATALASPKTG